MAKRGKKFVEAKAKVDVLKRYPLAEAIALVKEVSYTKFVGSMEIHVNTNANAKYNDQMIRGTIGLPHGTGKSLRIAAFVSPDKYEETKKAGADVVGQEELIKDIENGNIDFDILVTSADMMRDLARAAKIL
jgi:large subunit ribosomal protein L1